ncbi:nectin-1-like [Stegostoma tigrinum]|uniref:nectin-1-like n=1 Tax=Stegostoma tigrinum TaxID=3053191 RepID=UPI00287050FD|nr:nectin-1-like [Stegostoma tigrinum]
MLVVSRPGLDQGANQLTQELVLRANHNLNTFLRKWHFPFVLPLSSNMKPAMTLFLLSGVWLDVSTTAQARSAVTVYTSASISGYQEQTVTLPCHLSASSPHVKVVSITWKDPNQINIAVYNPERGVSYPRDENSSRVYFQNPSGEDATLVIRNFSRNDAGTYVCSWTTYPDGSFSSKTVLKISVAGRNSTRMDLDECPSEIVYTSVNIQQQNVRLPKKYCHEDDVDSEGTVYSVLKHK